MAVIKERGKVPWHKIIQTRPISKQGQISIPHEILTRMGIKDQRAMFNIKSRGDRIYLDLVK